jgi:hypothetical protein
MSNHGQLSMRLGTDKDEEALQDLFSQMPGFNTKIEHNVSGGVSFVLSVFVSLQLVVNISSL